MGCSVCYRIISEKVPVTSKELKALLSASLYKCNILRKELIEQIPLYIILKEHYLLYLQMQIINQKNQKKSGKKIHILIILSIKKNYQ